MVMSDKTDLYKIGNLTGPRKSYRLTRIIGYASGVAMGGVPSFFWGGAKKTHTLFQYFILIFG